MSIKSVLRASKIRTIAYKTSCMREILCFISELNKDVEFYKEMRRYLVEGDRGAAWVASRIKDRVENERPPLGSGHFSAASYLTDEFLEKLRGILGGLLEDPATTSLYVEEKIKEINEFISEMESYIEMENEELGPLIKNIKRGK